MFWLTLRHENAHYLESTCPKFRFHCESKWAEVSHTLQQTPSHKGVEFARPHHQNSCFWFVKIKLLVNLMRERLILLVNLMREKAAKVHYHFDSSLLDSSAEFPSSADVTWIVAHASASCSKRHQAEQASWWHAQLQSPGNAQHSMGHAYSSQRFSTAVNKRLSLSILFSLLSCVKWQGQLQSDSIQSYGHSR